MKHVKVICLAVLILSILPAASRAFEGALNDGTYEGEYSFVKVEVVIVEGKVRDIKMVKHGGGGEKYARMVEPMLSEMVERETVSVDAVTGATVSSENLKKAVEDALNKASQ